MSQKKSHLIIKHIVGRFLNPKLEYKSSDFKNISDILELPIYALKNVSRENAKIYQDIFKVSTIRGISKIDYDNPFNILIPAQTDPDIEKHLEKCELILNGAKEKIEDVEGLKGTILIANMIARSWQKRSTYLKKKDTKVITIGLDNAGKTAILSSLGGKLGVNSLANLKPTKRVERRKIQTDTLDLFLWDFGGQKDYRETYINDPEKYFLRTDLVIYVIDIQDPERYSMSLDYFQKILDIMQRLSENPYLLCFVHKLDPDLLADPDIQLHLEYLQDTIKEMMKKYPYDYDLYSTSIYNFFSSEPKFSKYIKDVMRDQQSLNDPLMEKMQGLGDILDTTLNAVVSLASSVGEQISKIDYRLQMIESDVYNIKKEKSLHIPVSPSQKKIKEQVGTSAIRSSPVPSIGAAVNPIKEIERKAMASRSSLNAIQAKDKTDDMNKKEQTRISILKDLQVLFRNSRKK
jgi:Gtr1/RagA G protein conserved region